MPSGLEDILCAFPPSESMAGLTTICEIEAGQIDLLEAAGYVEPQHLADADPSALCAELKKANDMLSIVDSSPELEEVQLWVNRARGDGAPPVEEETEEDVAESDAPVEWVDYESDPDVQDMIDKAPVALPIPNRQLAERGIPPAEVEVAPVLNHAGGDLDVRVSVPGAEKKKADPGLAPRAKNQGVVKVANYRDSSRRGFDADRMRTLDDARSGPSTVQPLQAPQPKDEDDRIRLLRTAREATNRGKNPESRSFVRGVLHDLPFQVWFGCLFVVLFQVVVPLAIISAPLLILSEQKPESFDWVPGWIIAFPIAVPISGLLCLMTSCRVKCRVCGQKVLLPRHCRKNVKAHHVRGLGYVLPLAVHTLIFRWFNCTFCGTSVRIKE